MLQEEDYSCASLSTEKLFYGLNVTKIKVDSNYNGSRNLSENFIMPPKVVCLYMCVCKNKVNHFDKRGLIQTSITSIEYKTLI